MSVPDRLCCKTIFGLGAKNIFLDWVHTENFDSKIQPLGFYYCPFPSVGRLSDEFCNTIGPYATLG
jgi:hypothetical protein